MYGRPQEDAEKKEAFFHDLYQSDQSVSEDSGDEIAEFSRLLRSARPVTKVATVAREASASGSLGSENDHRSAQMIRSLSDPNILQRSSQNASDAETNPRKPIAPSKALESRTSLRKTGGKHSDEDRFYTMQPRKRTTRTSSDMTSNATTTKRRARIQPTIEPRRKLFDGLIFCKIELCKDRTLC